MSFTQYGMGKKNVEVSKIMAQIGYKIKLNEYGFLL